MKRWGLGVIVLCSLMLASVSAVRAEEKDPKKQVELLDKIKLLERQISELTAMKQKQQTKDVKLDQCMKAVGVESLCTCVVDKLPASVDFRQYVNLLLIPAKELGYATMAADQKRDVDQAMVAWARCVNYKGRPQPGFLDGILSGDTMF